MRYLIFIVLPLMILSCQKEVMETNGISEQNTGVEVFAGMYDNTFNYYEYQPNFEVAISWDSQNLYGVGYDSIDLDLNGSFDLFITIDVLNIDSAYLLNGALPNPFPNCELNTSSEFQLAFYTENYPTGMGQTSSTSFVDRLDLNERIDDMTDWRNAGKMWQQNPGTIGTPPYGDWSYASNSNYIGIRQNGDKFGWIEIDASDKNNVKYMRYAICQ